MRNEIKYGIGFRDLVGWLLIIDGILDIITCALHGLHPIHYIVGLIMVIIGTLLKPLIAREKCDQDVA